MGYATLAACVEDLERDGHLVRIAAEVDPNLEMASIQRRAFRAKAPALLFTRVKGCSFPMVANLYGTKERIHYIFRDSLARLEFLFKVKADPLEALRRPWKSLSLPRALWHALPHSVKRGSVTECRTTLAELPQLTSWPKDGGAFVTLPLVYSEHPGKPGYAASNLGMYRVQLGGNAYESDEVGMHYQIHRGIGPHHSEALRRGRRLPVNVFVGGPPAMTLAAVMPLPEGISELHFAGVLGGMRIPMLRRGDVPLPMLADADFCLCGHILPQCKPEGPFGDHLGYYSLAHDFPVVQVSHVFHRRGAIWPFTSVGRPPQEDTLFGEFIHDLTGPLVPQVFSGVHEVHAVDAAGVHPLLLVLGSERYVPYAQERRPQELLTCAMNVLGTTQTALAKYVFMAAREDSMGLSTHDIPAFFRHVLERVHLQRDLHFITSATMDTLDYTGTGLNAGSKLIWAAAGKPCRKLGTEMPGALPLPEGFGDAQLMAPGIIVVRGPRHEGSRGAQDERMEELARALEHMPQRASFPLLVVADDAAFTAKNWDNFLWITFTRSDPATDAYGVRAVTQCKHWGCEAPLVLDARLKSFQAPPLEEDPDVVRRVEAMGVAGGPLHGYI